MTGCDCPRSGAYLCARCQALLARAAGRGALFAPLAPQTAPAETERSFQARVLALAKAEGWLAYHPYRSDKSAPGWPDVVLAKAGQPLVLVELKTATGTLSTDQWRWLDVLRQTEKPMATVWRPQDWDMIVTVLTRRDA